MAVCTPQVHGMLHLAESTRKLGPPVVYQMYAAQCPSEGLVLEKGGIRNPDGLMACIFENHELAFHPPLLFIDMYAIPNWVSRSASKWGIIVSNTLFTYS